MKYVRYDETGRPQTNDVAPALLRPFVEFLLNSHTWRQFPELLTERVEKLRRALIEDAQRQETARRNKQREARAQAAPPAPAA